jgi:hypothetical protein
MRTFRYEMSQVALADTASTMTDSTDSPARFKWTHFALAVFVFPRGDSAQQFTDKFLDAGAQVDAEECIHRRFKLSFVAWPTDADDTTTGCRRQAINRNYSGQTPQPSGSMCTRRPGKTSAPAATASERHTAAPIRSSSRMVRRRGCHVGRRSQHCCFGRGTIGFRAVLVSRLHCNDLNNQQSTPKQVGHHGYLVASAAIPRPLLSLGHDAVATTVGQQANNNPPQLNCLADDATTRRLPWPTTNGITNNN